MISIRQAIQHVKDHLPQPEAEVLSLQFALLRVLAQSVVAEEAMPRFDNSAMDGFAVRWVDVQPVASGTPVTLAIAGESRAGAPFYGELAAGEAAHISTGAKMIPGADTVVPVEDVQVSDRRVTVRQVRKKHQNVRFAGEEYQAGTTLLHAGTELRPPQLSLLASQGIAAVTVYRRPRVNIIGTGSELVAIDQSPADGQIRDSNGLMLSAAVQLSGGLVSGVARSGDTLKETIAAIQNAVDTSQIILVTGGVSVGPHDLVKAAAAECGFETIFWRVKQKPGKPLFFARREQTLLFGLPGNPVSAYMCYTHYVQPLLRHLQGLPFAHPQCVAVAAEALVNKQDRDQMLRITLRREPGALPSVFPLKNQGSHMLTTIGDADGYVLLTAGANLPPGAVIDVFTFS